MAYVTRGIFYVWLNQLPYIEWSLSFKTYFFRASNCDSSNTRMRFVRKVLIDTRERAEIEWYSYHILMSSAKKKRLLLCIWKYISLERVSASVTGQNSRRESCNGLLSIKPDSSILIECFIQKNCLQINLKQSVITNENFRSDCIEIKRIQVKSLFGWRQSIATFTL